MILQMRSSTPATAGVCADCGAAAHGNFCSSCGADLRQSSLRFLGQAASPVRRSFPAVYLKILRAPIRQTVAFAEDPSYRGYISFALAGIAIYLLFVVPIVLRTVAPPGTNVSESMLTLMKVLSQVGVYVGMAMAFLLAFAVFRLFAPQKRPFHAYFKLYCLALGFMAPIYGIYEFVVRSLLGGTGLSSFNAQMSLDALVHPNGVGVGGAHGSGVRLLHRHSQALLEHAGVEGGAALSRHLVRLRQRQLPPDVVRGLVFRLRADRQPASSRYNAQPAAHAAMVARSSSTAHAPLCPPDVPCSAAWPRTRRAGWCGSPSPRSSV